MICITLNLMPISCSNISYVLAPANGVNYGFFCIAELEVQDTVKVDVTSDEDTWAVKTLNLVGAIDSLLKVLMLLKN